MSSIQAFFRRRIVRLLGAAAIVAIFVLAGSLLPVAEQAKPQLIPPLHAQSGTTTVDWKKLRELDFQSGRATPSLQRLNGKPVRVAGFMVPLEDDDQVVSEFLLVPYPQACIHVPAPPPNQIVHVKMRGNRKAKVYWFEPIWAYGNLQIENSASIYAETSYVLTGMKTELYNEPYEEY